MKKIQGICLCLAAVLLLSAVVWAEPTTSATESTAPSTEATVPQQTQPADVGDITVDRGCRTILAKSPLYGKGDTQIDVRAPSALLYEVNSGTMIYAVEPDKPMDPSSLVKIMTLLVAVEKGRLDQAVTVTESALSIIPKSATKVGLQVGEILPLEELLYCLMTGSGNDAAAVVAEFLGGTQAKFVEEMNRRAKEIGCTSTQFVNAHGIPAEGQVTTARDLCRILMEAQKNETFATIFGADLHIVPETNTSDKRSLNTTNYLMVGGNKFRDSRVTGGRTAVLEDNGRSLASTAQADGMNLIAIVLGTQPEKDDRGIITRYGNYEDSRSLYTFAFDNLKLMTALSPEQILAQYPVANGANQVAVGTTCTVYAALPKDLKLEDLNIRYSSPISGLSAPIDLGQKLSSVEVWLGNTCLGQGEMVARNRVTLGESTLVDTWTKPVYSPDFAMIAMVVLVVGGVFALTGGTLYVIRLIRGLQARKRRKRRDARRRQ